MLKYYLAYVRRSWLNPSVDAKLSINFTIYIQLIKRNKRIAECLKDIKITSRFAKFEIKVWFKNV